MTRLAAMLLLAVATGVAAQDGDASARQAGPSGLPLPRFVSLDAGEANLRSGPGRQYPVLWRYLQSGIPLEIVAEFDTWRRVRDSAGVEGWMHASLLSGRRRGMVRDRIADFLDRPVAGTRILARAEPGVVFDLLRCRPDWCEARIAGRKAWVRRGAFWGTFEDEMFN